MKYFFHKHVPKDLIKNCNLLKKICSVDNKTDFQILRWHIFYTFGMEIFKYMYYCTSYYKYRDWTCNIIRMPHFYFQGHQHSQALPFEARESDCSPSLASNEAEESCLSLAYHWWTILQDYKKALLKLSLSIPGELLKALLQISNGKACIPAFNKIKACELLHRPFCWRSRHT